jgi:predicted MFS family arabinose efflux permease
MNGLYALSNQLGWAFGGALGGLILSRAGYVGLGLLGLAFALVAAGLVLLARSVDRRSPNPAVAVARPEASAR